VLPSIYGTNTIDTKKKNEKCVLLISGSDNKIFIWNVGNAEVITEVDLPEIPLSASWNWDGSKLVTTCKDKKIRLIDPRTGNVEKVITAMSYVNVRILCLVTA